MIHALLIASVLAHRPVTVVDGDTIDIAGERIQILDIDAGETHQPRCARERQLGARAAERLGQLLASRSIAVERHGVDRYRRTLAILTIDGIDIGRIMMAEGHAVRRRSGRAAWRERFEHLRRRQAVSSHAA